jgi:hypothetical protein
VCRGAARLGGAVALLRGCRGGSVGGGAAAIGLEAWVEVFGGQEVNGLVLQEGLEVGDAGL